MPDNTVQWAFAAYFALGSLGGILYIAHLIFRFFAPEEKYNPWEEMTRAAANTRSEPPISARHK
jgi:hypothetical protein